VAEADQGFRSLYTGLDLRGWTVAEGTDGRWTPKDWVLDYDGKASGKLSTVAEYGDFVLIFDWRVPGKDAAVSPSLCLRADTPGLHGRLLTLKANPKAREWVRTEIRVEKGRIVVLRGAEKELEDEPPSMPERGHFCLIAPAPIQFANVFIKELK
jgi:hypothetical protein